jgi:hypothetical protein
MATATVAATRTYLKRPTVLGDHVMAFAPNVKIGRAEAISRNAFEPMPFPRLQQNACAAA